MCDIIIATTNRNLIKECEYMKGIKIELLGISTILLGIALTTDNFTGLGYILGVLGFGIAVTGCFLKDKDK